MKNYVLIFLVCLISLNTLACISTKQDTNDAGINMLKEFYTAYNTVWATNEGNVLIKKLDSLQSRYCTLILRKELRKEFKKVGLDHDKLIKDEFTDVEHLNTLKVIADTNKTNGYIVSYIVFAKGYSKTPTQIKVVIHVVMVKENGRLKIASVK